MVPPLFAWFTIMEEIRGLRSEFCLDRNTRHRRDTTMGGWDVGDRQARLRPRPECLAERPQRAFQRSRSYHRSGGVGLPRNPRWTARLQPFRKQLNSRQLNLHRHLVGAPNGSRLRCGALKKDSVLVPEFPVLPNVNWTYLSKITFQRLFVA